MRQKTNPNIWKGVAAGALGGLAASFVMNQFQTALSAVGEKQQQSESEPATVKAAEAISTKLASHELTEREKKISGPAVHYAFGTANGILYGVLSEYAPGIRAGRGTAFGAGLWAVADEVAVPAFGFSKSPLEHPLSTHLYALASHLVYGLTTDTVFRSVRPVL